MNETNKKISFSGTNNRYQIKKLTENTKIIKKRKINLGNLKETSKEEQINILRDIDVKMLIDENTEHFKKLFNESLNKKLSSYKQQDILKNKLNIDMLANKQEVINKLIECNLECCYCKEEMYLLYEDQREKKQWTLDRIDNNLGHNRDNIVISCLDCNLNRRNKSKDAFTFTKQLNIIKRDS